MFFDPIYWVVIGAGMLLSMWASARVKGTFAKFSKIRSGSGLTGAQVAQRILQANNVHDVKIEPVKGKLTDHYDPRSKTLRLSEPVYGSGSLSALGVAAHEVGHAIQHAEGYAMLAFRSWWVPVANTGSGLSMIVLIIAAVMGGAQSVLGANLALLGVALFATTTLFTLVTLPVEFDASKRALLSLQKGGIMPASELAGARKVLNAAGMTYVAAFITSLLTLLYWAYRLGLFGGRR
ncbi:MAG: zinc metallopeptidase [Acidobacteria bacterium]|uniref:Zinc metallopeptidase n=1 Tax=Candidatus Polarisedimenticola svalbardensis TaxID=2886004 RepID=A0A8J6Y9M2_9BACT|nr:zinc metallopeptidase [Candidatus Polarisedimenticola svalbardensis]